MKLTDSVGMAANGDGSEGNAKTIVARTVKGISVIEILECVSLDA